MEDAGLIRNNSLDVVRGIAITVVILYHVPDNPVKGGLIGVDLFMVVSGYLVTKSLVSTPLSKSNIFEFWLRRIRRLLPAATTVVVVIAVIRFLFWTNSRRADLWDATSAVGFVANWRFVFSGNDYFRSVSGESPYQHLWSLAVEEQFYLFWPAIVFFSRKHLMKMVIVLISASFFWMAVQAATTSHSRAYYGTDTRMGTLLIGAALALMQLERNQSRKVFSYQTFQVGIIIFLVTAMLVDAQNEFMYRGGFLFVAMISAAIVWSATSDEGKQRRKLFGSHHLYRALTAVGLRSYSLYLVHWPIFALITPERHEMSKTVLLICNIFLTAFLAEILYRLVETRSQRVSTSNYLAMLSFLLITIVAGVVFAVTALNTPSLPNYLDGKQSQTLSSTGDSDAVLLIGDSVVASLMDLSKESRQTKTYNLEFIAVSGCGLLPGFVIGIDSAIYAPSTSCGTRVDEDVWQVLEGRRFKKIVWLSAWDAEDRKVGDVNMRQAADSVKFIKLMTTTINRLSRYADQVAVVTIPEKASTSGLYAVSPELPVRIRFEAAMKNISYAANETGSEVVDLAKFVCQGISPCDDVSLNGERMRPIDGVHFSGPGGLEVYEWLERTINPSLDN
jgi:peptidoglycan/LPS O-acetylase OafA/YrhL